MWRGQAWGPMEAKPIMLTVRQVVQWARAFHERRGVWPGRDSGPVYEMPELSWSTVDRCLKGGGHGLPGRSSLSKVLRKSGAGIRYGPKKRDLTTKLILDWADSHHMRTGQWPHREAGRVREAPGSTWGTIDRRMRKG